MKSEDTVGRVKTYEAIIKGQNIPAPGVPESFKVLIKELQALCLDIKVLAADKTEIIIPELDPEDTMMPETVSGRTIEQVEEETPAAQPIEVEGSDIDIDDVMGTDFSAETFSIGDEDDEDDFSLDNFNVDLGDDFE